MADASVSGKTCIKCGSTERRKNGQCRPCHLAASTAWKVRNEARIEASGEPRFYTYTHRRADDGKVFYVGKGRGYRATSEEARNRHWHRTKNKHGIRVQIVARCATESEAFECEKALIAYFRKMNQPLCNHTDGGDGPTGYKHTAETRAKLGAMQVGRKLSAEHRAKLSAVARRGVPRTAEVREKISRANKGKKRTPEQNLRNSEARRGKPVSAHTVAAMRAANTGRRRSAETRAKISASRIGIKPSAHTIAMVKAANTGIVRSAEFRAKVSAGLKGRSVSAETRAKIGAAHKGRTIPQDRRDKISKTLTGRRRSDAEKERLYPLTHSAEIRAKRAAAMSGRPWSEARRAALNKRLGAPPESL